MDSLFNVFRIHTFIDSIFYYYYKLNADSGETWTVQIGEPRIIARVDKIHQSMIFGKERTVKEIGYYRLQPGDTVINENAVYERYVLLVSGIGEYYEYNAESGPERILLGCVIDGDTLGTITSVDEEPTAVIEDFTLQQNYPNPFNPITTIEYNLKTSGKIILKVYSILGEEVKTLAEEHQPRGTHRVQFDARELASGMYIYTLTTDNTFASKKMLYIK